MSKLSDEQKVEIVRRHQAGELVSELALEFGVVPTTILRYVKLAAEKDGLEPKPPEAEVKLTKTDAEILGKRIRQTLWKKEHGKKEKKMYTRWSMLVKEYRKHGGLNYGQAIIEAAKEFPCLERLVQEYDSTPIKKEKESTGEVQVEGRELSHRENLNWAIEAAGKFQRIREKPKSVPNDSAFYLYHLAIDEPKDFLGKFNQIEARGDDEQEKQQQIRKRGQRTIDEINDMLKTLEEEETE